MKVLKIYLTIIILMLIVTSTALAGAESLKYPLVVYGGEPEGVMAAVAAARNGTKTLLVMEREKPGGLMTYGGLNYLDINYGPNGKSLNNGLFAEWHQKVGGNISFSINKATKVFEQMLEAESNLTVLNNTKLVNVFKENKEINKLVFKVDGNLINIYPKRVIDATQNADLTVLSDVPYFQGCTDIGLPDQKMAVTLVLHIGNIDWQGLKKDVLSNKYGPSHINKDHAWGFAKIGELYKPENKNIRLRGLNIVLENSNNSLSDLNAYINAMLIFNVDPGNRESLQQAYQSGKKEANLVVNFLKNKLGGFENAKLLDFPSELYVRETRHIVAEYQLKPEDLFDNKIFKDTIALGSYPLDYQASNPDYKGFVPFNPEIYGIPLRSLIPKNMNNLLVIGRSSGYSSLAAASARVLPTGMSTGEAAGIATAISLNNRLDFQAMAAKENLISVLQKKLSLKKFIKNKRNEFNPLVNDKILLPYLKELISWELVIGGYNNNFKLNKSISERDFAHIIVKGLKRRKASILYEWVPGSLETLSTNQPLTRDNAAKLLLAATSHRVLEMKENSYFSTAVKENLIPDMFNKLTPSNCKLNRREAYILLGFFLKKYHIPADLRLYRGENSE